MADKAVCRFKPETVINVHIIDSISGISYESDALNLLKRRFITWKALFQKTSTKDVPREKLLGIFGELTVLKDLICPTLWH